MTTTVKSKLSGAADGKPVAVAAIISPGTTIHMAGNGIVDDSYDEIYLWASNIDTSARVMTLEWGGTTAAEQLTIQVPPKSLMLVAPGLVLQNSLIVKAFADVANKINLVGFINKRRP